MPKVKRLEKKIHPNSRAAQRLAAKEYQKARIAKSKGETKKRDQILIQKIFWFKERVQERKEIFKEEDVHALIHIYFNRFNEELEQIHAKNSIGKRTIGQNFSREQSINMTLDAEKDEYQTVGIELPDMTSVKTLEFLKKWNGEHNLLPLIKLRRYKAKTESS